MSTVGRLPAVSAIVLAGGRAARFGRDKLAEEVGGVPLLHHAIDRVATVATEILVAGGVARMDLDREIPVRRIQDPVPDGGPLVGVLAGLEAAREPAALIVAGDMPTLATPVLTLLIRALDSADPQAVDGVALRYRGRVEPLPVVVRTGAATATARRSLGHGSRSLLGWLESLRIQRIDEREWRALDPTAATLLDVDRPADLERLT
jgi:molybdopterin-guanine dinucleotide biosynthesis protein A